MHNALISEKIRNINHQYHHPSYHLERKLVSSIQLGLMQETMQTLHQINKLERPLLASDSLRSIKNSLIGSCTLFTRAVIDSGLNSEDAFDLSDSFIKQIERFSDEKLLLEFEYEMVETFVKLVIETKRKIYLYPISFITQYIHEHVTEKISVSDLADLVYLSPDYLSRLFHESVGITIINYVHYQKIEMAKYMMDHETKSVTEVATLLEFCNPAYFTKIFKKMTGITPVNYKKNKYSAMNAPRPFNSQ